MRKIKIAEDLAEMLQTYAEELEEGERDQFQDLYIVDSICDMQEALYKDGTEEGRFYASYMLTTDKELKVFETIEVEKMLSGTREKIKIMSILEVKPMDGKRMAIEFLGAKVRA